MKLLVCSSIKVQAWQKPAKQSAHSARLNHAKDLHCQTVPPARLFFMQNNQKNVHFSSANL
jgi:hypothetical protein